MNCPRCGAVILRGEECPALCAPPPSPAPKYTGPRWIGMTHASKLGAPVYRPETDGWIGVPPSDS